MILNKRLCFCPGCVDIKLFFTPSRLSTFIPSLRQIFNPRNYDVFWTKIYRIKSENFGMHHKIRDLMLAEAYNLSTSFGLHSYFSSQLSFLKSRKTKKNTYENRQRYLGMVSNYKKINSKKLKVNAQN